MEGSALSPSSGPEKAGHLGSLLVAHGLGLLILTMGTATWTRSVESANGVGRCHHVTIICPPPQLEPAIGGFQGFVFWGQRTGLRDKVASFPGPRCYDQSWISSKGRVSAFSILFLGVL